MKSLNDIRGYSEVGIIAAGKLADGSKIKLAAESVALESAFK